MPSNIIPFGKYKGQPIGAMAADRQYVEWLLAQPWFRERFNTTYTLIVNNFQEPAETPAHNKLQARFLNREFANAFVERLSKGPFIIRCVEFECLGFDVLLTLENYHDWYVEVKPTVGDDYPAVLRQIKTAIAASWRRDGRGVIATDRQIRWTVLFLEEFTGSISLDEFIAVFENSGVAVVFLDEVLDNLKGSE